MRHAFFEGVPFEEVLGGKLPAPWTPDMKSQSDTGNFEKYPEGKDSARKISPEEDDLFCDF